VSSSPTKRFDVLGLGCAAVDDLLYVPSFPGADAKVRVTRSVRRCGGLTGAALVTAARLGEPDKAVDALFMDSPKNRWLANGHNYQSARLPLYLPGNGGLLTAVAMMAAGWDGCPDRPSPGFPDNWKWKVRWEGLRRLP